MHSLDDLAGEIEIPPDLQDWSISHRFIEIRCGIHEYQGSSLVKQQLTDISRFRLPANYYLIHADTPINPKHHADERRLTPEEWAWIIAKLKKESMYGVVVNVAGAERPPKHKRIIDLTGKTSCVESVAILQSALGYIGIDSWLSTLSVQIHQRQSIHIRSCNPWLFANRQIYYAPHRDWPFVSRYLGNVIPKRIHKVIMKQLRLNRQWLDGTRLHQAGEQMAVESSVAARLVADGVAVPMV